MNSYYSNGAVHNDSHKELNVQGNVTSEAVSEIVKVFNADDDVKSDVKNENSGTEVLNTTDAAIVEKLTPLFFGDAAVAAEFLQSVKGQKNTVIIEMVKRYREDRKLSDIHQAYHRELWTILYDAGIYTASESNWNMQVK